MSKNIAKSPEMIAKEAEVQALAKKIKKSRTTLKSLKTRLENSQQNFVQYQVKVQTEIMGRMEKVSIAILDLRNYAEKLQTAKFLSKEDRAALKEILNELSVEAVLGEGYTEHQEQRAKMERGEIDFEENARAKAKDMFGEFNVEPEEEEKRKIRQVFIGLSSKLHPDKARTDKEREDFHVLMQEVNAAYQSNDIEKLLEMERLYLHSEAIDLTGKAVTIDVLTEEINRLQRELDFIEKQISRTSGEIKNFRKSDLGKALTSANKAEKEGVGMDAEAAQLDELLKHMTTLRDALKDTWEQKKLSNSLLSLISGGGDPFGGANPFDFFDEEDDDGDIDFGDFFGGSDMGFDFDSMMDDFGGEPIKNPKFKDGQTVEVVGKATANIGAGYPMRGWTGVVTDSYMGGETEYYEVEFDTDTLQEMPEEYINGCIEEEEMFGVFALKKEHLKKIKKKYDLEEIRAYRTRMQTQITFGHHSKEIQDIITEVLVSDTQEEELENWEVYLQNKIKLPFDAKTRGNVEGVRKGTKAKVVSLVMAHPMYGLVMMCLIGGNQTPHPLLDLTVSKKADKAKEVILDAYEAWAKWEYSDDYDDDF